MSPVYYEVYLMRVYNYIQWGKDEKQVKKQQSCKVSSSIKMKKITQWYPPFESFLRGKIESAHLLPEQSPCWFLWCFVDNENKFSVKFEGKELFLRIWRSENLERSQIWSKQQYSQPQQFWETIQWLCFFIISLVGLGRACIPNWSFLHSLEVAQKFVWRCQRLYGEVPEIIWCVK